MAKQFKNNLFGLLTVVWAVSWLLGALGCSKATENEDSTEAETRNAAPKMTAPVIWKEPLSGMELILVSGACFQMGCGDWAHGCADEADEKPPHEVCLDDFYIGKYEVTQAQWQQVMGDNPAYFKKGGDYPVEQVSWDDARKFISKLNAGNNSGLRLPAEAEWEYAARSGGRPEKYAGSDRVEAVAWFSGNSNNTTHPVGVKYPNGLGIYDMSGNIWEWVQDWYAAGYYRQSPRQSPPGPATAAFRVKRGGSYSQEAEFCRTTSRYQADPQVRGRFNGFRLARSAGS